MTETDLGFDPDAPPVDEQELEGQFRATLYELRRIQEQEKELKRRRDEVNQEGVRLLEQLGRPAMIMDPFTGNPIIARRIQSRPIKVDSGELLEALLDFYDGDVDQAEAVWQECLKPREVDSKDDGKFQQAMEYYKIPVTVIAPILKEKPSSPYVGFGRPGGR